MAKTNETSYTLTEAAQVTGKSRVTMRRYLDGGKFPNAWQEQVEGNTPPPWRVPLGDLVAAGLAVHPADRVAPSTRPTQPDTAGMSAAFDEEVQRLREELAVAAALADERVRTIETLTDENTHLRSLLTEALTTIRAFGPGR
jgi:hypothetical protein